MPRIVLRWVVYGMLPIFSWILVVDWSWFAESCDDCWMQRDVAQYRVVTFPVTEQIDVTGRPLNPGCRHPNLVRWHKHKWWGLLICRCPCQNGLYGLSEKSSPSTLSSPRAVVDHRPSSERLDPRSVSVRD